MSYTITSNPDDSIDFQFGDVFARIRGSTWQKNNELAHAFGEYLSHREKLEEIKSMSRDIDRRLSLVKDRLSSIQDMIMDMEDEL